MVLLMFNNANKPLIYIYGPFTSFIVSPMADDVDADVDDALFLHVLCSEPMVKVAKEKVAKRQPAIKVAKKKIAMRKGAKKQSRKKRDCKQKSRK